MEHIEIIKDNHEVLAIIIRNNFTSDGIKFFTPDNFSELSGVPLYIYVGAKNHDKVIFNCPIIYFLAEKNPATKYHELNPNLPKALQEEDS